ncbi:DUF4350 domain-containing protein [Rhodocaloribacter sp.]
MRREEWKYVALLAGLILAVVALELFGPKPVDWSESYVRDDARPYGARILFDLLPALFPNVPVTPVERPPYLVLRDTTRTGTNYLFLTSAFAPDPAEAKALLDFAARGNAVFVAAHEVKGLLADTLRLETSRRFGAILGAEPGARDTLAVRFTAPALRDAAYRYRAGTVRAYFSRFDTLRAVVLGADGAGEVNFLRFDWGEGAVFVHALPLVFTNASLLDGENARYAYAALSHLPVRPVLWDGYLKPGRTEARTPLRFILRDPSLRQAYYLALVTVLLFIFFHARRRQRVIPVIPPLKNTTVEFVETVGRLYLEHGDHANLAAKKITYFLDYVRTRLRLPTARLDDALIRQVSARSGVPLDEVRALFDAVAEARAQPKLSEKALLRLSARMDAFYEQSRR